MSRFDESLAASQDLLNAALEREIAGASAALHSDGSAECIDCGCTISLARRRVYPSARRCLECQVYAEKEAYLR